MLGKLLVRRSGRVQLKLGDVVMDVSEGAAFSFLQVCMMMYYVIPSSVDQHVRCCHFSITSHQTSHEKNHLLSFKISS